MINQTNQIYIDKLYIHDKDENTKLDIRGIFEEVNIFNSIFTPCMSGSVVIRDAVGMATKLNFDGNQYITIEMMKDPDASMNDEYNILNSYFNKRRFVIWKLTDRKNINQSAEIYTLHFVSEEFLLSSQKKIRQSYKGTYTDIVKRILNDHLNVPMGTPHVGHMEQTKGIHNYIVPNISPFSAINEIAKKSISESGLSDFVFFQTNYGYNFISINYLLKNVDAIFNYTFGSKNIAGQNIGEELYGVRDVKIINQYDVLDSIQKGTHAGKFIGYDTLTGQVETQHIQYKKDVYDLKQQSSNKYALINPVINSENKSSYEMYDSRVTLYPFEKTRTSVQHLKNKDSNSANIIDDTHSYIFQRAALFNNLTQKRLRLVVPGHFMLYAGYNINLHYPNFFTHDKSDNDMGDETLSGKYMILSVRHIIKYNTHETIIEVASDSSLRGTTGYHKNE